MVNKKGAFFKKFELSIAVTDNFLIFFTRKLVIDIFFNTLMQ